jgi:hypothetical protein
MVRKTKPATKGGRVTLPARQGEVAMKRMAYWAVYALWFFFMVLSLPPIWICRMLTDVMDRLDAKTSR